MFGDRRQKYVKSSESLKLDDAKTQYRTELSQLTFNSKPIINSLTIIADVNIENANDIVDVIVSKIRDKPALPLMYLMDSILKNVGGIYVEIFGTHIVDVFIRTFRFAEPAIQQKLLGLLHTWKMSSLFKKDILDEIDMKVEAIKADIKRRQKEWVTPSTNVAPVSTGPILSSTPTMPPTSMTSAPVQSMPTQPQRNNNMIPNYTGPTYPYPNPMAPSNPHHTTLPQGNMPYPYPYSYPMGPYPGPYFNYPYPTVPPTGNNFGPGLMVNGSGTAQTPLTSNVSNPSIMLPDMIKGFMKPGKPDLNNMSSLLEVNKDALHSLYDAFTFQCKQCAIRFMEQKDLDKHYDWHFEINRREKDKSKTEKPVSRTWFLNLNDWLDTKGGLESSTTIKVNPFGVNDEDQDEDGPPKAKTISFSRVRANEEENKCYGCGETLEQEFDSEQDDWFFKDTLRTEDEGHLYHIKCYEIPTGVQIKRAGSEVENSAESDT